MSILTRQATEKKIRKNFKELEENGWDKIIESNIMRETCHAYKKCMWNIQK